jgi:Pyridoxamine 5'-phosphate oxidase
MAKQFEALLPAHHAFIAQQHIFFTASAAVGSRVNLSPRSTDCLRVIDNNTIFYLDRTGSGNETAAHLKADGRLTIMLCAVDGPPNILRLYGRGEVLNRRSQAFKTLVQEHFSGSLPLGSRQIIRLRFDLVQTSCGYGVPLFAYKAERPSMDNWAVAKGEAGIEAYWREKNLVSMDGLETGFMEKEEQ